MQGSQVVDSPWHSGVFVGSCNDHTSLAKQVEYGCISLLARARSTASWTGSRVLDEAVHVRKRLSDSDPPDSTAVCTSSGHLAS